MQEECSVAIQRNSTFTSGRRPTESFVGAGEESGINGQFCARIPIVPVNLHPKL